MNNPVIAFNNEAYLTMGFGAQRRYPNEELCRFMGRNYLGIAPEQRGAIRVLELGCGSASNLWMIAREGFDAYGIDLSPAAIPLAQQMLQAYGVTANLAVADMTELPWDDITFDCVLDVYSSYCLNEAGFRKTLSEVARVLKPGGRFFCYTPGKGSDAWTDYAPAKRIDGSTLNGIHRSTSAYAPAPYPFRFVTHEELAGELSRVSMHVTNAETVTRTYRQGAERFEFVVVEARAS